MKFLSLFLTITLAACATNDVTLGGPGTLVRVDPEAPGLTCPTGGTAINTGLDLDGDTFLDDDEIASTQHVCNGATLLQCEGGVVKTGPIAVRSDAELATLAGVHCVDGDLLIAGVSADSLDNLADLTVVTGDLVIVANPAITSMQGLGELRIVGGTMLLQGNDALVNLAGLAKFRNASALSLVGNNALTSLAGLEDLHEFAGSLRIANNTALASLQGLDNLATCHGTLTLRGNNNLTSLAGLANLRDIKLLEIASNKALTTASLPLLQKIDVRLLVTDNAAVTRLAVPMLVTTGDFIRIDNNPLLTQIDAGMLVTTAGWTMTGDAALTALNLPNLTFVTAGFDVRNMSKLASITAPQLTSVGTDVTLDTLPALLDFAGLSGLRNVGGNLTISNNKAPQAVCQQFANRIAVSGTVTVRNNGL